MYSSVANKMQRYKVVFITINALHISGGSTAHHQELKTLYVYSIGYLSELFLLLTACVSEFEQITHDSGKKQKKLDNYPMLCVQF